MGGLEPNSPKNGGQQGLKFGWSNVGLRKNREPRESAVAKKSKGGSMPTSSGHHNNSQGSLDICKRHCPDGGQARCYLSYGPSVLMNKEVEGKWEVLEEMELHTDPLGQVGGPYKGLGER